MEILILATVILSAIIAIPPGVRSLLRRKTVAESLDPFMDSFLGGLLGGLIGTIIGCVLGYLVSLIIPSNGGFMFSDFEKWLGFVSVLFICWFVCVLYGGIKTIKPLIKFFSDGNN